MPKTLTDEELSSIFGEFNFVKTDDLIGNRFMVNDFEATQVEGYEKPATKVYITLNGNDTEWTSFSDAVRDQLQKLKDADALPVEVGLIKVKSTKRKGASFTKLVK